MAADRSGTVGLQHGSQPRVSIVILNWNGLHDTLETLESVNSLQYENVETFVVDNGSTDQSREAIAATFPGVHLIVSPENLGVAGGRNFGLQVVLCRPEIDYVLFLDNDVIVEPTLLDTLVAVAEARPEIGILGPIVYYRDDPKRIRSDGVAIVFREVTAKSPAKNRLEKGNRPEGVRQVDAVNGCCMLIKRKVFETIGYFNPAYYMLNDETEFCYRAGRKGFHSAVVMYAALWHKVSASTGGGYTPGRAYYTGRCTILFLKEHGRPWHWVSTIACVALSLPLAYLREWRRGNQQAVVMKFRGYVDGLLDRPIDPEVEWYFQRSQSGLSHRAHVHRNT